MTPSIDALPAELLDQITADLALRDYQAFRLASRQLYCVTLSPFCTRFFATVTTTLGPPSLDRLLNVSSRGYLANAVTTVDVRLLTLLDYQTLQDIVRVGIYPPPKRFPKVTRVKPQHIRQESNFFHRILDDNDFSDVVSPLARALQKFSKLSTVKFRIHKRRAVLPRFGPTRRLMHARSGEEERFQHTCLNITLDAVIKSGIKLHELSLPRGSPTRGYNTDLNAHIQSLTHGAFRFSIPRLLSLKATFSSLKSLVLSIDTAAFAGSRDPGWANAIANFISTALSVETLALILESCSMQGYSAAVIHALALAVGFASLRSLQLYGCVCDEQDLATLFSNHSHSLRRISLDHVQLRKGSWMPFLPLFRDSMRLECVCFAQVKQQDQIMTFPAKDGSRTSSYELSGEWLRREETQTLIDVSNALVDHHNGSFEWPIPD